MLGSLFITLREGLEAALIIAIILAYLAKTGNRTAFRPVWWGTFLAILASLVFGTGIYVLAGDLSGRAELIYEGLTLLIAAGVLTWMILWMHKQAVNIRGNLQAQVQSMLMSGSQAGLLTLAFVLVVREGIETVLFLFAATRVAESPASFAIGGVLGMAVAVAIGYTIYRGTSKLNLRSFFNITSIVLIVFAAGLLAHGIHEFEEAALIPPVIEHVWNTGAVLPDSSGLGRFLTAIVGYSSDPSLVEALAYFAYLGLAFWLYFRPQPAKQVAK